MSECVRCAAAALAVMAGVSAQSPAGRPSFTEFEVASIKPTPPDTSGRWIRMLSAHEFRREGNGATESARRLDDRGREFFPDSRGRRDSSAHRIPENWPYSTYGGV